MLVRGVATSIIRTLLLPECIAPAFDRIPVSSTTPDHRFALPPLLAWKFSIARSRSLSSCSCPGSSTSPRAKMLTDSNSMRLLADDQAQSQAGMRPETRACQQNADKLQPRLAHVGHLGRVRADCMFVRKRKSSVSWILVSMVTLVLAFFVRAVGSQRIARLVGVGGVAFGSAGRSG
jgi:hypothetical protein